MTRDAIFAIFSTIDFPVDFLEGGFEWIELSYSNLNKTKVKDTKNPNQQQQQQTQHTVTSHIYNLSKSTAQEKRFTHNHSNIP